jgi:uncharacterized protein YkwD
MHRIKNFLHHLVIPRESNNHRAKLLHYSSLLLIIAALLLTQIGFSFTESKYPGVLGVTNNISIDELVQKTNQKRAEQGLAPLSFNAELANAAGQKAQHMLANNYWAHNAPDGTTPWVFFKNAGYQYIFAGENLARGFSNTDDVINAWMASPGHKENIMSPNYKEIGFAVVTGNLTGEETVLVVEMFGSRNTSVAQAVPPTQAVAKEQVSPTQVPLARTISAAPTVVSSTPTPTVLPTTAPTRVPVQTAEVSEGQSEVASFTSSPLVNEKNLSKNITTILVLLLLGVLLFDLIIVERKKIVRLVSHNIDHIIYLSIILITILLFGRGVIL